MPELGDNILDERKVTSLAMVAGIEKRGQIQKTCKSQQLCLFRGGGWGGSFGRVEFEASMRCLCGCVHQTVCSGV